jgi:trehalose synthase-fused probable maltokinase
VSAGPLRTLRVSGGLGAALSPAALAGLDGAPLVAFLGRQRWFGGKGAATEAISVCDVIPLFDDGSAAVARVTVDIGGRTATYQLVLAVRPGDPEAPGAPRAVLARVEAGSEHGILFDALEDAPFRRRLGQALRTGASFGGSAARWVLSPFGEGGEAITVSEDNRLLAGEQSNSSVVFGEGAILKLYRRVEPGEHPDVEIGELLTATAFAHVPALLATIRFQDVDGSTTVAGMVQRLVVGASDCWEVARVQVREQCAAADGAPIPFAGDAARLGRLTRALHEELANACGRPAFTPLPVTEQDLDGWAAAVAHQSATALGLLAAGRRDGRLDPPLRGAADGLLARRAVPAARARQLARSLRGEAGQRIRHHGDYHLGQILRTPGGEFLVVDFEGEPTRPLAERRERHSALRDVAGMLRSFAYAAAIGCEGLGPSGAQRAARWERAAREAFLDGYLGDTARGPSSFLPASRSAVERAVALFELEKAFYELAYELNHRPDWVHLPLRSLGRLLAA